MKQLTAKELKETVKEVPDDYKLVMHYDGFIFDPIDDIKVDHTKKQIILK